MEDKKNDQFLRQMLGQAMSMIYTDDIQQDTNQCSFNEKYTRKLVSILTQDDWSLDESLLNLINDPNRKIWTHSYADGMPYSEGWARYFNEFVDELEHCATKEFKEIQENYEKCSTALVEYCKVNDLSQDISLAQLKGVSIPTLSKHMFLLRATIPSDNEEIQQIAQMLVSNDNLVINLGQLKLIINELEKALDSIENI